MQRVSFNLYTKYEPSTLKSTKKSITENYSTGCIKRKNSAHIQIRTNKRKLSLLFCIPNMNFQSYIVVEISLTKMWRERKDINKEE